MTVIISSVSQGLLWALLAIGIYMTFRILHIADLTVEGSYPLGAAVAASAIVSGVNPILATVLAGIIGSLAGAITGFLHTKLNIPSLLSGIVTLTALYSINLKIMGKANVTLLRQTTLVTTLEKIGIDKYQSVFILGLLFLTICIVLLTLFFKTQIGLALRATGDNAPMSQANGINVSGMKIIGYMISNGLVALSGALLAQNNGYADINSGVGTIVIGLSAIMIGEALIKNVVLSIRLISIICGAIIYRLILLAILSIPNIDADLVRLFSAILLAVVLSLPELKQKQ